MSSNASPPADQRLPPVILVLGGARSGKSAYAEQLIAQVPCARPAYVATAEAGDTEMGRRIAVHLLRRGGSWRTVEAPLDVVAAITEHAAPDAPVVVDCLTLWLSNLLAAGRDPDLETDALVESLQHVDGPVVLVSNEVGLGIVPNNALARDFRDAAGRMHQAIAAIADRVVLVTAGLPLVLKDKAQALARKV